MSINPAFSAVLNKRLNSRAYKEFDRKEVVWWRMWTGRVSAVNFKPFFNNFFMCEEGRMPIFQGMQHFLINRLIEGEKWGEWSRFVRRTTAFCLISRIFERR
jgi:hypothetical protein